nr:glycosyltransferase [Hyphomicrobium sulfonivorans]
MHFAPLPRAPGSPLVMLASRMLWDKGVGEFVDAARQLTDTGARFVLVGRVDDGNPSYISEQQLRDWVNEGIVEWWGQRSDMVSCLNEADIICLPSYREGLPKSLLEAMSCGKPCITTNVTGCRDAVRDQDNGLLVPARDAAELRTAVKKMLADPAMRERMGTRGRQRALEEFGLQRISNLTFDVYSQLISKRHNIRV